MTQLVPVEEPPVLPAPHDAAAELVRWAEAASAAYQLAKVLVSTSFAPDAFRGRPEEGAAAIIAGAAIGLDPIAALQSFYVTKGGRPALYAARMVAIVQSHGHQVWTESSSRDAVTVCGRRRGSPHVERVEFTIARARAAKYAGRNAKYDEDPESMLYARAASIVCRRIAADALSGMAHSAEELEDEPREATVTQVVRADPPAPVTAAEITGHAEPTPAPTTAPAERGVTDAQLRKLHATLTDLGITGRDERLAYVADVIGRDVGSSKDLTAEEASRLIDHIDTDPWGHATPGQDGDTR